MKMSDMKKLVGDLNKMLVAERDRARADLPVMLDLVTTYIRIAKFADPSILDDANDLEEKVNKAL
jgi:hypothetical protein